MRSCLVPTPELRHAEKNFSTPAILCSKYDNWAQFNEGFGLILALKINFKRNSHKNKFSFRSKPNLEFITANVYSSSSFQYFNDHDIRILHFELKPWI